MITIAEALAASHQRASEFTRSLFEESWTSDQVVDFINRHRNATIATTNPQGQPHAAVVIAGSVDQGIYFTVAPSSVLARNITSNGRQCQPLHTRRMGWRLVHDRHPANLRQLIFDLMMYTGNAGMDASMQAWAKFPGEQTTNWWRA